MKHYYKDASLFGSEDWFKFASLYRERVLYAPSDKTSKFVEVGAFRGRSTAFLGVEIINSRKPIELYVVDHFEGSREHKEMQLDMSNLDAIFHRNIKPIADALPSRFFVFAGSSVEAAGQFLDRELDFVMLDGSHEYEDVLADIRVWYPKVKPGGMLAGDDWQFKGVSSAVTEEFSRNVVIAYNNSLQYPWWYHIKPIELEI